MRVEDVLLINEIGRGNKVLYQKIFEEYYEPLVRFAFGYLFDRQESEDLVQELFVFIWEHKKEIKITSSIKSYLFQSVKNRCLNCIKSLKVTDKRNLFYGIAMVCSNEDIDAFEEELVSTVKSAVNELPEQMSKIFVMKYVTELTRNEIAEELNISVNTVKTQLRKGKSRLRENLLVKSQITFLFL